jgi:hypothetical protein
MPKIANLISDEDMRALARQQGVREVAFQDCILGYDDTEPFVTYLKRIKPEKPHWWNAPEVETVENKIFYSLAAQSEYVKAHGEKATADLLATEHLKLGQVKAPVKVDPLAKIKGVSNPYDDAWKGTEEARQAAIVALLASKDPDALRRVASLAKAGGRSISGQKLQPVGAARFAKK